MQTYTESARVMARMSITTKIKALRERSGLTMAQIAKKAGWKQPSSYQRYEDPNLYKKRWLTMEVAHRLINAFVGYGSPQISRDEILALTQPQGARLPSSANFDGAVEVIAVVEAGVWREAYLLPQEERQHFPRIDMPGFDGIDVFALVVRGKSMGPLYPDGSTAFFVKPEDLPAQHGHTVVSVSKRRNLYEITLKEFRRDRRGRDALWPLSATPGNDKPAYVGESDGDSVEIIGVVIGKFQMMTGPTRTRT